MPNIEKPSLNRKERWTRDYILPLLPSDYKQPMEVDGETLEIARSILAKQYVAHAKLDLYWKSLIILLMYDIGFRMNSQIYGLVLAGIGSILLALPNLYTPELLAEDAYVKPSDYSSEIEDKAVRSVKTNVGVAGLVVGFVWQIFTISGSIPTELVTRNYLTGMIPGWQGFVVVLVIFFLMRLGISAIGEWR